MIMLSNHPMTVKGKPGYMVTLPQSVSVLLKKTGDTGWASLHGWEEDIWLPLTCG